MNCCCQWADEEPPTPSKREFLVKFASLVGKVASPILTLFLIAVFVAYQSASHPVDGDDGNRVFLLVFVLYIMMFPLLSMLFLINLKFEYIMREWAYYGLLKEGVLIDFDDDNASVFSVIGSSPIGWYMVISGSFLLLACAFFGQWGLFFAVLIIIAPLVLQIYEMRQVESNLISVNKFIGEDNPLQQAEILHGIVFRQDIIHEADVAIEFTRMKLVFWKAEGEALTKANAKEERKKLATALDADGIRFDFKFIADKLKRLPASTTKGARGVDVQARRSQLQYELSAFRAGIKRPCWEGGFGIRANAWSWESWWASDIQDYMRLSKDEKFFKTLMSYTKGVGLIVVLAIEVYGLSYWLA
mmetsp:Transcript_5300/g.15725  ORF Transcript_5300/g.15725 Transcript_5300/m.15725 type:complete len:359 (-) Transcript_5300:301-1377(-)|eukprot:CAMPEP_0206044416 /NCGR_PEP_ID=MMETSP1466-20131121/12497_1 /ASSEMBLY_ACC=CAM_ASM_001126 /TAXON_ID=44452 /ORGANISM="Pavlova gyrans, Strain CCMP608" /LENGTH=358 /DNA_ID=CAMNT_0053419307 /DNA_START=45 /DNA_END=1121 /DNA_ORIENTATION=-